MHRCLEISELLLQIFKCTQESNSYEPDIDALASLARTSRAFSEPALDMLWAPRQLHHLVRLMPADLWDEESVKTDEHGMLSLNYGGPPIPSFARPLEASDWIAFQKYSHRVRHLSSMCLTADVVEALANSAPAHAKLFSGVQTIRCDLDDSEPAFTSFCTAQAMDLQSLTLVVSQSTAPYAKKLDVVLHSISRSCPNITSIGFFSSDESVPDNVSQLLCDFVCKHGQLGEVVLQHVKLTQPALCHVASLSRLQKLVWSPTIFYPPPGFESKLSSITSFSHEANEGSNIGSLEALVSFLKVLPSSTKIVDFFCILPTTSTSILMQQALLLMGQKFDHHSLEAVRLTYHHYHKRYIGHVVYLGFGVLKPLLSFRSIERIELSGDSDSFGLAFDIDDYDLQEMARAWPLLTSLNIETTGFKITVDGFLRLFTNCSKLTSLGITVNFNVNSLGVDYSVLERYQLLRELHVGHSKLDDPRQALDMLKRVFPKLIKNKFKFFKEGDVRGWKAVQKGLPVRSDVND